MLRAATACNFSSLIWPAGSAPATLVSLLFDPPEPQIIGKTQCFATFSPFFAHLRLLSSDSFSSTLLSSNLSLLSASALLCFSSVHTVGSFKVNFRLCDVSSWSKYLFPFERIQHKADSCSELVHRGRSRISQSCTQGGRDTHVSFLGAIGHFQGTVAEGWDKPQAKHP